MKTLDMKTLDTKTKMVEEMRKQGPWTSVRMIIVAMLLGLTAFSFVGCDDKDEVWDPIPATPQGVYSITGDRVVWVYWNGIYERDVRQYIVYRSLNETTGYTEIARINAADNPNLDLLIYEYADQTANNGTTYYYAVASLDMAGQVSALSAENVFDTPRPEGTISIFPNALEADLSGFNFETASLVNWQSATADVFVDSVAGIFYLNAADINTDIQDLGFTDNFDEIGWAPDLGWSQLGFSELILGHTYVIWTADNHFAKMRALSSNASGSVTFQWAWQSVAGNPELAPVPDDNTKKISDSAMTQVLDPRVQ